LQDQNVIPYIFNLAGHEKPLFRATAAWTMGQTKDPQFLPALEKLTHDLYASVRKSAARGMEQMPKPGAPPESAAEGAPTSQNQ
jgi:Vesicle coat complex, various subunits